MENAFLKAKTPMRPIKMVCKNSIFKLLLLQHAVWFDKNTGDMLET